MDGETNGQTEQAAGNSAEAQVASAEANKAQQTLKTENEIDAGSGDSDSENTAEDVVSQQARETFEAQLKERDDEISALKAEIADAIKSAGKEKELTAKIAELEAKAERERIDYELTLAGCRSTRTGRALLEEHDGDVSALKEAESWGCLRKK